MIQLKGIGLQYIVGFEEAYLNMTNQMTVITGLNKDSRISLKQNNASGKSTLVSAFPSALYESAPVGKGKDRSSGMTSKDSCIQLDMIDSQGKKFCIQQRKAKYFLSDDVDGDLQAYKLAEAKKVIQERFPLTEEEFYTYVYIHGSRPFDFRFGTSTNQFSFIAKLFRLDIYDQLKNEFRKRRDDCSKAKILHDAIQDNIVRLQLELEKYPWRTQQQKELSELEASETSLAEKIQKLIRQQTEYATALKQREKFDTLMTQKSELTKEAEGLEGSVKFYVAQQKLAENWETYLSELKGYTTRYKQLKGRIVEGSLDETRRKHSELVKQAEKLDEQAEAYEEAQAKIAKLEKSIKRITYIKVAKSKTHWETIKANAEYVLELEELKGEKECHTCRQPIDPKVLNNMLKQANLEHANAERKLKQIEDNEFYKECKRLLKELRNIEFDADELEALEKKIAKYESLYDKLKRSDVAKELISQLEKPKKPKKKQPKEDSDYYADCVDILTELAQVEDRLSYLGDVDTKKIPDLQPKINKLQKKWKKVRSSYVTLSVNKTQNTSLKEQLSSAYKEAKKQLAKVDLFEKYDFLFKQYGGPLKQGAIDQVLLQLENILNRNADLVFVESLKFHFEVKNNTIESSVSRNYGKPFKLSKLSDSEGECFRLLFAYALATLVPDNLRVDTIILDEPDKACDDVLKEHLVKNFIPTLQKLIPNVVWVTPKNSDVFSNCRHLTVIKEDGQSRLERS